MKKKLIIDNDVIDESIGFYGKEIQTVVCMEECAELIQAISKVKRGKGTDNLCEEMADVYICLSMLRRIYGISWKEIQDWIDYKQRRTSETIVERRFIEFEKGAKN